MEKNIINKSGKEIEFAAAEAMMDEELREELCAELAPCTNQEFFSAYESAHEERFGEEWELSKANPVW
jgi:hypothetical protein